MRAKKDKSKELRRKGEVRRGQDKHKLSAH